MERLGTALQARRKRGFTMVEVLIVAPVLLLLLTFMVSTLISMYGNVVAESHKVLLRAESQKMAATLTAELNGAVAFLATPDSAATDGNAPADGWIFNTQPPTLITKEPAYSRSAGTPEARAINRQPDCTDPAAVNHVYFISENDQDDFKSLYRRTIVPPRDSLCGNPQAVQTCPAGAATDTCPADRILSRRIDTFAVTYLDDAGKPVDVTSISSVLTPDTARSVRLDITLGVTASGKSIKESTSITAERHGR